MRPLRRAMHGLLLGTEAGSPPVIRLDDGDEHLVQVIVPGGTVWIAVRSGGEAQFIVDARPGASVGFGGSVMIVGTSLSG